MSIISEIISVITSGGWVMIPLYLLAILLYGTAFHLVLFVYSGNIKREEQEHWRDWICQPEKGRGRVGQIIRYTQEGIGSTKVIRNRFNLVRNSLISIINRRLFFMDVLIGAAPLLGLLGTVIGMLLTFQGIASGGGVETADSVASGISAALVTTQTGLMIALPALFIAMVIRRKKHSLEADLTRLESLTLSHISATRDH